MSKVISEIREFNVQERIITLDDIRTLAKIIEDEAKKASGEEAVKLYFFAYCEDNSSFQSEDAAIFEDNSALSRKRVIHVKMGTKSKQSEVSICLSHGNEIGKMNRILVQGIDSPWVNGVLKLLEEAIGSFKPQNTFLYKNELLIQTTIAIGIGSLFIFLILLFLTPFSNLHPQLPIGILLVKYIFAYAIGLSSAKLLQEVLKELWPSVELQIGPEHALIEKRRRNWIAATLLSGVLPLLLQLAYDIMKGFATH